MSDFKGMSLESMRAAVQSLSGANIQPPKCNDHNPRTTQDKKTGVLTVSCAACGFTVHMSPETYNEIMMNLELDEIGEEIRRNDNG